MSEIPKTTNPDATPKATKTPPAGVPALGPQIRRTGAIVSGRPFPGLSPSITGQHAEPPAAEKIRKVRHSITQAAGHLLNLEKGLPDLLKDIDGPTAKAFGFDIDKAKAFSTQVSKALDTIRS